jgi:serine/threonine protein kinase
MPPLIPFWQGNILINQERRACLSDFGLTAFAGPDVTVASTTERGARRWMAPELLRPDLFNMEFRRTRESDIYAFACICCEVFDERLVILYCIHDKISRYLLADFRFMKLIMK